MEDVHTPGKYRLKGSLMLSDEFAKDFNCPQNSPMRPKRNCPIGSLWPDNPLAGKNIEVKTKTGASSHGVTMESSILPFILAFFGLYAITC